MAYFIFSVIISSPFVVKFAKGTVRYYNSSSKTPSARTLSCRRRRISASHAARQLDTPGTSCLCHYLRPWLSSVVVQTTRRCNPGKICANTSISWRPRTPLDKWRIDSPTPSTPRSSQILPAQTTYSSPMVSPRWRQNPPRDESRSEA